MRIKLIRNYSILFVAVLLVSLSFFACGDKENEKKEVIPEGFLIKVNEKEISFSEYERRFKNEYPAYAKDNSDADYRTSLRKMYAFRLLQELILNDVATKNGIRVTKAEIDSELENRKEDYPGDEFEKMLSNESLSLKGVRASIESNLLKIKVLNAKVYTGIAVSEEEVT